MKQQWLLQLEGLISQSLSSSSLLSQWKWKKCQQSKVPKSNNSGKTHSIGEGSLCRVYLFFFPFLDSFRIYSVVSRNDCFGCIFSDKIKIYSVLWCGGNCIGCVISLCCCCFCIYSVYVKQIPCFSQIFDCKCRTIQPRANFELTYKYKVTNFKYKYYIVLYLRYNNFNYWATHFSAGNKKDNSNHWEKREPLFRILLDSCFRSAEWLRRAIRCSGYCRCNNT